MKDFKSEQYTVAVLGAAALAASIIGKSYGMFGNITLGTQILFGSMILAGIGLANMEKKWLGKLVIPGIVGIALGAVLHFAIQKTEEIRQTPPRTPIESDSLREARQKFLRTRASLEGMRFPARQVAPAQRRHFAAELVSKRRPELAAIKPNGNARQVAGVGPMQLARNGI